MAKIAHILFPYDFSTQAARTAPFVRAMAARLNARVTLYAVVPPAWDTPPEGMMPITGSEPEEWKQSVRPRLDAALATELSGIDLSRVVDVGDPAMRIKAYVEHERVDLVMMPTRGQGTFRALLLGSVTSKVLHDVHCPIWTSAHIDSETSGNTPQAILCAVDASEHTPALCRWAVEFAVMVGATLRLTHVVTPVSDFGELAAEHNLQESVRQAAETRLRAMLQQAGVTIPLDVVCGNIGTTVSEQARTQKADLVIAGRGLINETFGRLRAHTFDIIQQSAVPVISV